MIEGAFQKGRLMKSVVETAERHNFQVHHMVLNIWPQIPMGNHHWNVVFQIFHSHRLFLFHRLTHWWGTLVCGYTRDLKWNEVVFKWSGKFKFFIFCRKKSQERMICWISQYFGLFLSLPPDPTNTVGSTWTELTIFWYWRINDKKTWRTV